MKLKNIISEDFINYKKPSMFLISSKCDWKCCKEQRIDVGMCQNSPLVNQPTKDISVDYIYQSYINNPITHAIVIGGLEPILQFDEIIDILSTFRARNCLDDVVIYTGYYKEEIANLIAKLKEFPNVIIKFGRYIPNEPQHYDEVLGINLASNNQYAEKIS